MDICVLWTVLDLVYPKVFRDLTAFYTNANADHIIQFNSTGGMIIQFSSRDGCTVYYPWDLPQSMISRFSHHYHVTIITELYKEIDWITDF